MFDKLQFVAGLRHSSSAESPDKLKFVGHFWIRQRYRLTPLSHFMIDQGMGKRRQAKALQRLPPILMSKLNAIGVLTPVEG